MKPVSLSKLLKKNGLIPLICQWVSDLNTSITLEDHEGKPLLVTEGACQSARYPVMALGQSIGWVTGTDKVAAIASLLGRMAEAESEKRALARETLSKYKEITLLYDTAERISACLDTKEVARLVIAEARQVIRCHRMSIAVWNPSSGTLDVIGQDVPADTGADATGVAASVWPICLEGGRAGIVNDVLSDRRFDRVTSVRSLMYAPLKTQGRVFGVIWLGSDLPATYSAEDLRILITLTSLAASAIENAGLYEQLHHSFYATVYTLAETIEKRDPYTGNHTKRVVEYSLAIGRTMGLSADDMHRLQMGAVLHDVGKIGLHDTVLLKTSRLTPEEFEQVQKHPAYGQEIIARIPQLQSAVCGVLQHHEQFDGKGYPRGLKGSEIDLTARIIAVADAFDAMTSNRPYRNGLSLDIAFEELRKHSGSQFDPAVVDAFFASDVMEAFFTANARRKILS